jgi:hypothetical protein
VFLDITETLADTLVRDLGSSGSPERVHVSELLRQAPRMILDEQTSQAAAQTLALTPETIKHNLDQLSLLGRDVLWIEYPYSVRTVNSDNGIEKAGCLLAANPSHPHHIAIFLAWRGNDGITRHSHAILHWDLAKMRAEAALDGNTLDILAEQATVSVPPGFIGELEILGEVRAANDPKLGRLIDQATKQVLGEHLFLLSALLLVGSSAVEITLKKQNPTSIEEVTMRPPQRTRGKGGFRKPWFNGPLSWSQPLNPGGQGIS